MKSSKTTLKEWLFLFGIAFVCCGAATYYILFYTPKNSLELYQAISFADNFEEAQKLMLKDHEANFSKEDFEFIQRLDTSPERISQFTLFEYDEKSYVLMTTPGTQKLEILAVEELPKEVRDYFIETSP